MNFTCIYDRVLHDTLVGRSSIHGPRHWARVERNGLYLSQFNSADPTTVRLFALLHDSMRVNDGTDPEHGSRAAEYAATLRSDFLRLDDDVFDVLAYSLRWHTEGNEVLDDTVATCWDADRLDLGRVGITPDPELLFTAEAKRIAGSQDYECLEQYIQPGWQLTDGRSG